MPERIPSGDYDVFFTLEHLWFLGLGLGLWLAMGQMLPQFLYPTGVIGLRVNATIMYRDLNILLLPLLGYVGTFFVANMLLALTLQTLLRQVQKRRHQPHTTRGQPQPTAPPQDPAQRFPFPLAFLTEGWDDQIDESETVAPQPFQLVRCQGAEPHKAVRNAEGQTEPIQASGDSHVDSQGGQIGQHASTDDERASMGWPSGFATAPDPKSQKDVAPADAAALPTWAADPNACCRQTDATPSQDMARLVESDAQPIACVDQNPEQQQPHPSQPLRDRILDFGVRFAIFAATTSISMVTARLVAVLTVPAR